MKLAFVSKFDAKNVHKRSGTPYYMSQALLNQGVELEYIGSLKTKLRPGFKIINALKKMIHAKQESSRNNTFTMLNYSKQVKEQLANKNVNAVLAHISTPIAYLECKEPIVLWTDALYAAMLGFNPFFANQATSTIEEANAGTASALSRCKLAIFSSDWAARSAKELYGVEKDKIHVVPFGANIDTQNTLLDVKSFLKKRSPNKIKLLFIGKEWNLKGGDIVFNVAKALHAANHSVELNFVGCIPPANIEIPHYIICHGYISKKTPEGMQKITQLLSESHFLFVPSRAEAFGIVFCEANAFGLPCLTSHVGGIPTIVKNDINGMTFSSFATTDIYCDYIINLMQNYSRYEEMALSAFHEFERRLNWDVATKHVKKLIENIL